MGIKAHKTLYDKYIVERTDGTDEGPGAVYFVLRLDKNGDYHAQRAMLVYLQLMAMQKNYDSAFYAGLWQLVRKFSTDTFKELGIKPKYKVRKTSGKPLDPGAKYFVIRVDEDPFAEITLKEYAGSVYPSDPRFAGRVKEFAEHRIRMW